MADSSTFTRSMAVEPASWYPCTLCPKIISSYKSDAEEELVMAPALPEELVSKLLPVTMYLKAKYFLYMFCYRSALLDICDRIVRHHN
jgi:hypothetical protein